MLNEKFMMMFSPDGQVADIAEPDYQTTTGNEPPPPADIETETISTQTAVVDTSDPESEKLGQILSSAKSSEEDIPDNLIAKPKERMKQRISSGKVNPKIDSTQTQEKTEIDAKAISDKVETKPEEKKDDAFDPTKAKEEVDKAEPRPGSHPKTVDDFRRLKTHAARAVEDATKARKELEEFRATMSAAPKPEEIKAKDDELIAAKTRIAELENFEFMVRPEASAVLKREYDEKIQKSTSSIYDLLSKIGLKEEPGEREERDAAGNLVKVKTWGLSEIKAKGGPLAYAPYSWWATNVLPALDPLAAKQLDAQLMALHETGEARKSAIESAPQKAQEIQAQMRQTQEAQGKEWIETAKKRVAELEDKTPYGKPIEITATMTADEKKNAQEINTFHEEVKKIFPKLLAPQTAKEAVDVAAGFANGMWLERDNKRLTSSNETLQKRVEELETKLNLRKKASDTTPSTTTTPTMKANPAADRLKYMLSSMEDNAAEVG